MRVLLDECIDRRFARDLPDHTVRTVPQMGWATIKNGELLRLAEKGFDVFITMDRNLSSQQYLAKFDIAVIVLRAPSNRLANLLSLVPEIIASLLKIKPKQVITVGIQT